MLNVGYIEVTGASGAVSARVYYDANSTPVGDAQPLINGPEGYCLLVRNVTGARRRVTVQTSAGVQSVTLQQGDPVTSQSRTANQLRQQWDLRTRGDVQLELLNVE
jgi:hypothetical protein